MPSTPQHTKALRGEVIRQAHGGTFKRHGAAKQQVAQSRSIVAPLHGL
jgi:hypothetical protein